MTWAARAWTGEPPASLTQPLGFQAGSDPDSDEPVSVITPAQLQLDRYATGWAGAMPSRYVQLVQDGQATRAVVCPACRIPQAGAKAQ